MWFLKYTEHDCARGTLDGTIIYCVSCMQCKEPAIKCGPEKKDTHVYTIYDGE